METIVKIIENCPQPNRIDRVLLHEFPLHSRTYFQELIKSNHVLLNGKPVTKASLVVKTGDALEVTFPPIAPLGARPLPAQDLAVKVVFEHEDFLIVYKPAGLTVHSPNQHDTTPTLVDWLVHYFKEIKHVGDAERPGIVHRLDKDTSGIMIVARTPFAHAQFSALFQNRQIEKTYLAVVEGHIQPEGIIDFPIGRHLSQGHKMTTVRYGGREALTSYKALNYFTLDSSTGQDSAQKNTLNRMNDTHLDKSARQIRAQNSSSKTQHKLEQYTLVELRPKTGRTHQLRVHCTTLGHSIVGDSVYGNAHDAMKRQALHAYQLSFTFKDRYYSFSYSMPEDIATLIKSLETQR